MDRQIGEKNVIYGLKGAIFDLDGTLLDSLGIWEKIDIEFLGKRGILVPPLYADKVSAMTFHEAAAFTVAQFGLSHSPEELMREWHEMALYHYANTVKLKSGAEAYLRQLHANGIKLSIATSLERSLSIPALENNGVLSLFSSICSVSDVSRGKGFPDIFVHASSEIGLSTKECIVFEDVHIAASSAQEAGCKVCGVYDERTSRESLNRLEQTCDFYITDYSQAPILL